jgi:CheY-like chemotaxis protein
LNSILGFGQLLQFDPLPQAQHESVAHIMKAGQHLLDLINEVLDIARIEAGHLTLSTEPVELRMVAREVVDLIRPLAVERGLALTTTWPEASEDYVVADRQRLKQVLLNLLSNAVKYNREHGSITVSCQRKEPDRVALTVSDTGAGIAPDKLERLFTPFDRLGAEATGIEGTGLGLALSHLLTAAMHGELGVESTVGAGSTFWIALPATTNPKAALALQASPADDETPALVDAASPTRTILYIEDNLSNLTLVQMVLARRAQVTLLPAMQGRLGLELAREHNVDLILLDLHLPDISGLEVLRRLQTDARTHGIPVIVLTADASPGQLERLLGAGARAYLTKPLDLPHFLELVDELIADDAGRSSPRGRAHREIREDLGDDFEP